VIGKTTTVKPQRRTVLRAKMPPRIAFLICIVFIIFLFRDDIKNNSGEFSIALWIPLVWMFFAGSRRLSKYLSLQASQFDAYHEGTPLDAALYAFLIIAGILVLARREIEWKRIAIVNLWILIYYFYCLASIIWSDHSFIAFKRLTKELGNLIMVLVILTEKNFKDAITVILKRLAYLWIPLSFLFFKYFPILGRDYAPDGRQFATGVSGGKNGLGILCMICIIYFSWNFLVLHKEKSLKSWKHYINEFFLLGLTLYLLYLSKSATALACSVVSVAIFLISRFKIINEAPARIMYLLIISGPIYFFLDAAIDIKSIVLEILGRDETLTTRVFIWDLLKSIDTNPIWGVGYQSFWLGERLEIIWDSLSGKSINQAHNGYLEQYLNLGYIGVCLLGAVIVSGIVKIRRELLIDYPSAVFKICIILIAVLYNYTEALFYGINNIWFLTLLAVVYIPEKKVFLEPVRPC
jgi:O-antigen ligase